MKESTLLKFGRDSQSGGGAEAAVYANWSAKAEYLYVSLNDSIVTSNADTPTLEKLRLHLIRAGLNYKF
ncbi:MAG: outer membrane protein [Xanthobacteraceae bacterium]